MSSTFSGFYVAKSGIQAARANLQVTGQNMTNVNTPGYTRQRVDSYAVASTNNGMRYASTSIGIGQGVNCTGVNQIRDPYLDIRYRTEHAKTGKTGTQLDTLEDIDSIFDETTKDGISAQFADLVKQMKTLGAAPSYTLEGIVKNSAQLLTKALNKASAKLDEIRTLQTKSLKNDEITNVNSLLKNIAHLNEEIKSSDISGTSALELMDQRNTKIDELSKYANINVSSKQVDIGSGKSVSELHIDLVSGDKSFSLVSDNKFSSFDMTTDADTGYVTMALKDTDGNAVQAKDSDGNVMKDGDDKPYTMANADLTEGTFSGYLTMLNEKGEFDSADGTERGIGYYENVLDKLAVSFANTMNTANSTNPPANDNKPLFSTTDGKAMAAGNICLSEEWNTSTSSYMTNTKQTPSSNVDTTTLGDNILYMVDQLAKDTTYRTSSDNASGKTLFTTSIEAYVSDLSVSVLGLQENYITQNDTSYNSTLSEIDKQRSEISSVDVNEEGINLIMYNQSLTASSRFMTTLDEALDTIINKMGIVGR
nr:flagellar hook-associated protein FlgK [uncultured Caproiciproducens sp.]